jgi:hypothetical protein
MDVLEAGIQRPLMRNTKRLGWEYHTIRSFKILTFPGILLGF